MGRNENALRLAADCSYCGDEEETAASSFRLKSHFKEVAVANKETLK